MLDNLNYMRNTEYHSEIEHGATWAGTQIWPQFYYRHNPQIQFKLGVMVQKDFGNNAFRTLIPTYTLSYTRKNTKVNFGTLDGSVEHNLIEPLYAIENLIDKRIENGIQVKGNVKRLDYDVWVDWEKMIYRNSDHPELFTAGLSSSLTLVKNERIKLDLPLQLILRHQGGEIYSYPHSNIKTQSDLAYGLRFEMKNKNAFFDKVQAQAFFTFYEDLAPAKADSFFDGTAQLLSLSMYHKNFGIMANYWDAHQYISPLGDPIYLSKSKVYEGIYIQYRKMVMLRFFYEARLWDQFTLVGRVNNIYNLSEKKFDNAVELMIKINLGVPIKP